MAEAPRFDFIIVGGGSAGCALANRLSADPANRVLVLEAGRPDWSWDAFIHMPAALAFPIGSRFYDWRYESEPEQHMNGRRVYHARGKVLGGSSSVNGMIFQRGNPLDYERWARDEGMESWHYANCLPYFKRMENCLAAAPDDPFRGHDGPLILERGPARGPLFDAFFAAVQEAGYPLTADVNGYRQEGFAAFDRNVHDGRRLSAARAYLHPVMARPNLEVETFAFVTRIRFDGDRAVGVEFTRPGRRARRAEAGEIVLCGGAINSPQLLQLSGIGAADELRALGIDVVQDLPGVGENLQDHLEVYIQHSSQPVSVAPHFALRNRPRSASSGCCASPGRAPPTTSRRAASSAATTRSTYPNLMHHFLPIAVRYDGTLPPGGGGHGYQVHVGPMYSDVRGTCKIKSADPHRHPALLFNYLSTENDRREWLEAIRVTRTILVAAGLAPPRRRRALARAARSRPTSRSSTGWPGTPRPRSTPRARAGWGPTTWPWSIRSRCGCTAPRGCGWSTPRSSRTSPNGNIYAPVMMTAEKAADLILGNTPLAPEPVEFYRHRGGRDDDVAAARLRRRPATRPGSPCGPSSCRSPAACATASTRRRSRTRRRRASPCRSASPVSLSA